MMQHIKYYSLTFLTYLLMSVSPAQAAFDDAGTDYTNQQVENWFDMGDALTQLGYTDFLTCLIQAAGVGKNAIVNTTYKAIADVQKCRSTLEEGAADAIDMIVRSSKLDNNPLTPQKVEVWYNGGPLGVQVVIEFAQTVGLVVSTPRALTDTPYGAFTMNWRGENDSGSDPFKGSLSFTPNGEYTDYKLFDSSGSDAIYINGSVKNDLSSGHARSGFNTDIYLVKYTTVDGNFTAYEEAGGDHLTCRDETSLKDYIYDYNLYDKNTGVVKNLFGPFSGTYIAGGETKRMHAGPSSIWFEDLGDTHRYSNTAITHENGTTYSGITYEPLDDGNYVTAIADNGDLTYAPCSNTEGGNCEANDGLRVHIPGVTFDQPLVFEYSAQENSAQGHLLSDSVLTYLGKRSFYGMPWHCRIGDEYELKDGTGNCDDTNEWKPSSIPDGTAFKDTDEKEWVTKGVTKESTLGVVNDSVCNNAGLSDVGSIASSYDALTSDFLTPVTITWADSEAAALKDAPLRVEIGPNGENGYLIPE